MKNVFNLIAALKEAHLWKGILILFPRAQTLEKYFQVVSLINRYEQERKYGFRKRLLIHPDFVRRFGCQDEILIQHAIREMEAPCDYEE